MIVADPIPNATSGTWAANPAPAPTQDWSLNDLAALEVRAAAAPPGQAIPLKVPVSQTPASSPWATPSTNPYASPQISHAVLPPIKAAADPASRGQRFANFFIDGVILRFVNLAAGVAIGFAFVFVLGPEAAEGELLLQLIALLVGLSVTWGYYFVLEAACGCTVGKLVTGTKVISAQGGKPSIGQLVGRTFCRLIPFEPLSFFRPDAVGWHDSLSGTRVVRTR